MDAMLPAYQSGAQEMPLLFCVPMLIKDNFDTGRRTHPSTWSCLPASVAAMSDAAHSPLHLAAGECS